MKFGAEHGDGARGVDVACSLYPPVTQAVCGVID